MCHAANCSMLRLATVHCLSCNLMASSTLTLLHSLRILVIAGLRFAALAAARLQDTAHVCSTVLPHVA